MDSREIEKRIEKMEAAECPDYALLRRWAEHPDALIREQVAAVLVFGAGEPGREILLKLAADSEELVRAEAYEAVTATFTCAGKEFTAKGRTVLSPGWKEIDRRFRSSLKTDSDEDSDTQERTLPELTEGQTFSDVAASVTEHFATPPKPYTEDTLLSAMERAGAEDMPCVFPHKQGHPKRNPRL